MKRILLFVTGVAIAIGAIVSWRQCTFREESLSVNENGMNEEGLEKAYFAGGCFWGVEHQLEKLAGVLDVRSGYMGGTAENPSYADVSTGATGHAETVEVTFDSARISYREVAKRFFEIHDPTELNRQGPDVGSQYRSAVFFANDEQRRISEQLIDSLRERGYAVVTVVLPAETFFQAEEYHQDYYGRSGGTPYCHVPVDRFGDDE